MDLQHLLCGINVDKLRSSGFFRLGTQIGNLQLPRPPTLSLPRFRENLPNLRGNIPNLNLNFNININITRPEWPNINMPNINLPNLPENIIPALKHRYGAAVYSKDGSTSRKHLPVGSGPHTVGCFDLMFDHTAKGTFVRLYYPVQPTDVFKREAQWPLWLPRKQYGKGYAYFLRKNTKIYGTIMNIIGGDVYVPVLWQAPVLDNSQKLPVIIFSHGLGGNRTTYTTICSDFASHGYIVAAMEHRDGSASMTYCYRPMSPINKDEEDEVEEQPDDYRLHRNHSFREEKWLKYNRQEVEDDFHTRNKQMAVRVEEIQQVLGQLEALNRGEDIKNVLGLQLNIGQFKGRFDMNRLAIVGHSFGGGTIIAALANDKRFKVGVALDSWMLPLTDEEHYQRVNQPILFINTDTFQWNSNVRDMYKLQPNDPSKHPHLHRVLLTLRGTCHQSQTDFQFMIPAKMGKILDFRHRTEPTVAMDLNQRATLGFLAKHLNIADQDHHEDILMGQHNLVVCGTNLDLTKDERTGPPGHPGARPSPPRDESPEPPSAMPGQ